VRGKWSILSPAIASLQTASQPQGLQETSLPISLRMIWLKNLIRRIKQARFQDLLITKLRSGEMVINRKPHRAERGEAGSIKALLEKELHRLSWRTNKLKVRVHQIVSAGDKAPKVEKLYLVDLGSYRGLNANELYYILKNLDTRCGHRAILRCVERMEQRVAPSCAA
jgi:hypothetical protein